MQVNGKLESAGHKPSKEERKIKAARDRVIEQLFGKEEGSKKQFADPAAMFG